MNRRILTVVICFVVSWFGGAARGSIIVDHQPHPFGGLGSDTLFRTQFGQVVWQQVADDFSWTTSEQLTGVNFWGFYQEDSPPTSELFRLRIYLRQAADGLPGTVAHEEMIQNPNRTWTGRPVYTEIERREYLFETTLAAPVTLDENSTYWLEVVQVGDITTTFRWEDSTMDLNGVATSNIIHNNWLFTYPGGPADAAFQLVSPEPTPVALIVCAYLLTGGRRFRRAPA